MAARMKLGTWACVALDEQGERCGVVHFDSEARAVEMAKSIEAEGDGWWAEVYDVTREPARKVYPVGGAR